jgi:diguanylate cyclase (GGDEF)-like protein
MSAFAWKESMDLQQISQGVWTRYAFAVVLIAVAAAVRIWPLQELDSRLAWLTFYPAVVMVAFYGGFLPGFLATVLACIAVAVLWPMFAAHPFINNLVDSLGMAFFALTGVMISGLAEAMHRTRSQTLKAQKESEQSIEKLAFYDQLTGLPNRRHLMDRLQHILASSARGGRKVALLCIDLDNFRDINGTLGHDIGDILLQQTARRLETCLRKSDTVAHLGGDEFVAVLENLSGPAFETAVQAKTAGEKILAALSQPYQLAAHQYHSTTSIGAAIFRDNEQSAEELLKQAVIAVHQAKKAGRNTLCFFDPQMQASIAARVLLEGELRKALESRQFQLYYQIQVDNMHCPLGAEALIRWIHPLRGMISPGQFIPLAEKTGLILPIGEWVLETACAQLKSWQSNALTRKLVLAVNVSAKQFHQEDFVAQVQSTLQRHAIDPMLLKLELTEGMLLENINDTIATMKALKKIGVQFSLDDFGTGYSSLQYLRQLPFDQIKIDQSFVRDICTDSNNMAIVSSIIAMTQSLMLSVIAEGVETGEQRQLLLSQGCTHYQGYLFGKPVPVKQFEALLRNDGATVGAAMAQTELPPAKASGSKDRVRVR